MTARKSFLCAAGCLTPTREGADRVRWADIQSVRRVWAPRRRPEDTWLTWQQRTGRAAEGLLKQAGEEPLLSEWLRCHFRWAGHVARMEPDSLIRRVADWKSHTWWKAYHSRKIREDPRNKTYWKHPEAGGQLQRWDQLLWEIQGSEWQEKAQDRIAWGTYCEPFVKKCLEKFKLPANIP